MKKVFLDTNILLDYGQQRDRHDEAETIFCLGDLGKIGRILGAFQQLLLPYPELLLFYFNANARE